MFAGACNQDLSLRLQSPCAHTSELVSGGTNVHAILPVNGLQQELGICQGRATTTYFDSASTVFVAKVDVAAKKSVWLERRRVVLTETTVAEAHGEIDYILNLPGDPPDCHEAGWIKVAPSKNKTKTKAWQGKGKAYKA